MTFGSNVKTLRKQRNLTQEEFAALIGVHESHVGRYERDESVPTAPILKKIAQVLRVSIDLLLADDTVITDEGIVLPIRDPELLELFKKTDVLNDESRAFAKRILNLVILEDQKKK